MISLEQIRAARGLLNWSQVQLAAESGLSTTAMNNIDRGYANPRASTLATIRDAFEKHGVEFIAGNGVRLRKDVLQIETYDRATSIEAYLRDMRAAQKESGLESLHHAYLGGGLWQENRKVMCDHIDRMIEDGLKERVLLQDGIKSRIAPTRTAEYRWYPKHLCTRIGYSVCGDRHSLILSDRIVVIENRQVAEAYRRQFDAHWKESRKMPPVKSLYEIEKTRAKS